MKTKKLTLFFCFFILSFLGYTQQNPDNEILVFFIDGVSQKVKTINGQDSKLTQIDREKLRQSLEAIGISDSTIEVALPKFDNADTLKILSDGQKLKQPDMTKLFRIKVPKNRKRQELIDKLNKLPEVLYAEPNGKVAHHVIPSDTRFNDQWGIRNTINPGSDIHAEAAWDVYTGNPNNIIAIIDGGTDIAHVDLNDKISGGDIAFGWLGHGIHVSGIAAAESNNSQGITGVDWNARIHPQRIDNVDDAGTYQAIVDAVNYSPNVFVLNNSWGLVDENQNPGRYSTTVRQAFAYAYKANRTCVASMGNHQQTNPGVVGYPGGFGNIIAVGATDNSDVIAGFSVQGNHIDVCAPGVDILSTINGTYGNMSGTSMAAPHVSGIASLLKGFNPNLANDDIENIIKLSADQTAGMNGQNFTGTYGFGRVNAERALNLLQAPNTLNQWSATGGTVSSSTGTYTAQFIAAPGLSTANYLVKRHEVRKTITFPSNFLCIGGVWGRGVSTTGWNLSSPNFGEGFCEVVPGTQTNTGVTLRTYIYEIWSISGSYLGYYPQSPSNVSFAYSVLGIPSPVLSGPSVICSSGATYTINNVPAGCTVTWNKSSNLNFDNQPGNSKTFTAGGPDGSGWVQATIVSACGNVPLPAKTVWAGIPPTPEINSYTPFVWSTSYWPTPVKVYTVYAEEEIDFYDENTNTFGGLIENFYREWNIDAGSVPYSAYDYGSGGKMCFFHQPGSVRIRAKMSNSCGETEWSEPVFVEVIAQNYMLSLSPNPASGEVTVELKGGSNKTDRLSIEYGWDLDVYDAMQSLKTKVPKIKDKSTVLNTSGWKDGVYVIRAMVGKKLITGKLVVKH